VDMESVSSSGFTEGTANIRSGRVQLQNAYGSEFLPLPIPMTIQFWNGSWQPNTADTCTVILPSQFAWDFLPAGVAPRANSLTACRSAATTISGTAPNYTVNLAAPGANFAGWANLTLNLAATALGSTCTAVNSGTGYSALATTANAPWLQFNWIGTLGNPTARATFGSFRSPLIYRRENY